MCIVSVCLTTSLQSCKGTQLNTGQPRVQPAYPYSSAEASAVQSRHAAIRAAHLATWID